MKLIDPINFIQGTANYHTRSTLPKYYKQQILMRMLLCRPCMVNGKCTECGCKTPEMFYSPLKTDSKGKWIELFNEKQWTFIMENADKLNSVAKQLKLFSDEELESLIQKDEMHDELVKKIEQSDMIDAKLDELNGRFD